MLVPILTTSLIHVLVEPGSEWPNNNTATGVGCSALERFPESFKNRNIPICEVIDNFFDEVLHKSLLTRGALGLNSCFGSFWIALGIQNFKTFF